MKKIKKIHIILNPASGRGEAVLSVFNQELAKAGIEWDLFLTKKAGDGTRLAKEAIKASVDAIGVYGGDGTLMEVICGMMGSSMPLVIFPGGSANVMATGLGIPKDLREACRLLCEGPVEEKIVDVGQFGKHFFIVGMSMGFEAEMIKGADRETKNKVGILAYFISAAGAVKKMKEVVYTITVDGREEKVRGLACSVVNAANLGFTNISLDRHIDISDGLLDVLVVRKINISFFKHVLVTLLRRERPDDREIVAHWQGKEIIVASRPQQPVQCDGEVMETKVIHARCVPDAVTVMVPGIAKSQKTEGSRSSSRQAHSLHSTIMYALIILFTLLFSISAKAAENVSSAAGIVSSVNPVGDTLSIQTPLGETAFIISSQTKIVRNAQEAGLLEIRQGDPVIIEYTVDGPGKYTAQSVIDQRPQSAY